MAFLRKSFFCVLFWGFFAHLSVHAQWREHGDSADIYRPTVIARDSLKKYWREMIDAKNFVWTGIGIGFINPDQTRFADEASFIPKKRNDVYTVRLRLSYSNKNAGEPVAYLREASVMYGKVHKGYHTMFTASAGISYVWGRKWLDKVGVVVPPPARGLRQTTRIYNLYNAEKIATIGIPLRLQALVIAGKEVAFGFTLGTNINFKKTWLDAMFTMLLGIN